jgi:hypothetical protein
MGARDAAPPGSTGRRARVLGLLAGGACAAVALARADLGGVRGQLAGVRAHFLALAVAANCVSLAIQAARWRSVVRAPGIRVRYRDALVALVSGFAAGIALPARGGDLVRAHLLARRSGLETALVLAASLLDHVVGAVALVAVLAVVAASVPLPPWAESSVAIVAAVTAVAAAAAWMLRPRRGAPDAGAAAGLVARLRGGLAAVHEPRALLSALAWAGAGLVAEGAVALATLVAVGLPATPAAAALAVLAGSVAAAVPLAPGNAGSFELATTIAMGGVGASSEAALAFALVYHLAHLVPVAVLGGGALLRSAVTSPSRALPPLRGERGDTLPRTREAAQRAAEGKGDGDGS